MEMTFEKLGYGFLATTHNDGRAVFCKSIEEAKTLEGHVRGALLGVQEGFIIEQTDAEAGFGFYVGTDAENALKDAQRLADENTGDEDEKIVCLFA